MSDPVELDPPAVILIFGPNCVGKSTVGRALAGRIARCAFLEVDELRYLVVGGLVAWSAGQSPREDPAEYRRQCQLGLDNAVRLSDGFAAAGFSSVMEGLEDTCRPPSGWAARAFPGRPALHVALTCADEPLLRRLRERGGMWARVPRSLAREWLAGHALRLDAFDAVVDTTDGEVDRAVDEILRALRASASQRATTTKAGESAPGGERSKSP